MYSTVDDVRDALAPGGSNAANTAASLEDVQIRNAIEEADSTIDSYLLRRYSIPQEDTEAGGQVVKVAVPPVRWYSRNIAAYLATLTWRRGKDIGEDDPVRLRYRDTVDLLRRVQANEADLSSLPPFVPPNQTSDVLALNAYEGTLFGPRDFSLRHTAQIYPDTWPGSW